MGRSAMSRVMEIFRRDRKEHERMIKSDPYYAFFCGGGVVPAPCCRYCVSYDGERCMKEWNNLDPDCYVPERDDKDPDDLCEDYSWSGEWEDE